MKNYKVGDHVKWNSEAGHLSGKIIKVHHASENHPQYEIKSDKSNHIAAHKGTALSKV